MNPLETAPIGKTDLQVSRLGIGCGPLGGLFQDVPEEKGLMMIRRALTLGINFLDTAPVYGNGKSEIHLGRALADTPRSSFVLATKVGRVLNPVDPQTIERGGLFDNPLPFVPVFDFSADGVMRSFEESLKRLNLDRIDILHIHDPDDYYEDALRSAYPALTKLRSQGVIRAVGAGMNQAGMLARLARDGEFDCFLLANRYTLLDHTGLIELLPLCVKKGISIIIGGPYNSGILATGAQPGAKYDYADAPAEVLEKVRKVQQVCARYGVPMKAAALQFPLAHPAVAAVIPGVRSVDEVEENFRLLRLAIPAEFWSDMRKSGLIPDEAPTPGGE